MCMEEITAIFKSDKYWYTKSRVNVIFMCDQMFEKSTVQSSEVG